MINDSYNNINFININILIYFFFLLLLLLFFLFKILGEYIIKV